MVAAAMIGAAVVGGVASSSAANSQAKAAKAGADAQVDAASQATALDREIYYDQRGLLTPSITAGAEARAKQMLMTGSTPEQVKAYLAQTAQAVGPTGSAARASDDELQTRYASLYRDWSGGDRHRGVRYDDFNDYLDANGVNTGAAAGTAQPGPGADYSWVDDWDAEEWLRSTPGYEFNFSEGQRGLERGAAARGDLYSGGFARELTRYGNDYADGEWDDLWGQFGQLAGDGADATGTTVNVAGQFGQNATGNIMAAGNARASGYQQVGEARANEAYGWGNAITGAMGAWGQYGGWK